MRLNEAPAVEVQGLHLAAAGRTLLADLQWQVRAGERWAVIGRNAAGKSTLLRALAGLSVPQRSGRIAWQGRDQDAVAPADAAALRAYVPQQPTDRFAMSVRDLLALCRVGEAAADQALSLLDALDAGHLAGRDVTRLSGGERQRVSLAQAAMQGAPLLLLDEPVSFQDPAHQQVVAQWLRALPGHALVFSAHEVNWLLQAATHVLALQGEGVWVAGTVEQMITAEQLERTFGCRWRAEGALWRAA